MHSFASDMVSDNQYGSYQGALIVAIQPDQDYFFCALVLPPAIFHQRSPEFAAMTDCILGY